MSIRKRKSITGDKIRAKSSAAPQAAVVESSTSAMSGVLPSNKNATSLEQGEKTRKRRKRKSITGIKKRPKRPEIPPAVARLSAAATSSTYDLDKDESRTENESRGYSSLRPQIRYISQDVVRDKWKVVPEPAAHKIQDILRLVERSVIGRHGGDKLKIKAQEASGLMVETLKKCLPRVPFPPGVKEFHFDYEGLLKENRLLETRLNEIRQSVRFLQDEIERERLALAAADEAVAELEDSAQIDDGLPEWELHQVLPLGGYNEKPHEYDHQDQISLERVASVEDSIFQDADLREFQTKIAKYMEELQGATEMREAVARKKADLEKVIAGAMA